MAVRSAAHKALAAESRGALISASLHAEVVYDLGPYRGVAQALRKFGTCFTNASHRMVQHTHGFL